MTPKQRERFIGTCEDLESLPPKQFYYGAYAGLDWGGKQDLSCGTAACALGRGIAKYGRSARVKFSRFTSSSLPMPTPYGVEYPDEVEVARRLYGDEAAREFGFLFLPECGNRLKSNANATQVAKHLRRWLAKLEAK